MPGHRTRFAAGRAFGGCADGSILRMGAFMKFEVVDIIQAGRFRERFIERFVNTKSEYYRKYCHQADENVRGFLWDSLKSYSEKNRCTQEQAAEFLEKCGGVYFMWDLWRNGTMFADKYPNAVIKADGAELGRLSADEWNAELEAEKYDCYIEYPQLPSDIYVFDESFTWCVIFTHEFEDCDSLDDIVRFCIIISE